MLLPGLTDPDPALEAVTPEDAVVVVEDDIESFPPPASSFPPPTPKDPDVFGALETEDVFCFFRFVSSSLSLVRCSCAVEEEAGNERFSPAAALWPEDTEELPELAEAEDLSILLLDSIIEMGLS